MNKKIRPYILMSIATIIPPVLLETTGNSVYVAKRQLEHVESMYPENNEYFNDYRNIRENSTRMGVDFTAAILGLSAIGGSIVGKRKLEEFLSH